MATLLSDEALASPCRLQCWAQAQWEILLIAVEIVLALVRH